MKLSIVIPCFNEETTLERCLQSVLEIQTETLALEILVVDDCSTDNSLELAEKFSGSHPEVTVLRHERNRGKGAALQTGFQHATGQIVAIQDADLEYDPKEYPQLIKPILDGKADVVFGSRFSGATHRVLYFWHRVGNGLFTFMSNMFTNLNLTDMETGYKAFRREVIQSINIEEDRFGFEPEITAKIARGQFRIYEVGIGYFGRTYVEGKKIGWRDGFWAIWCILKYNLRTN